MATNYLLAISTITKDLFYGIKVGFLGFLIAAPFLFLFGLFLYLSAFKHQIVLRKKTKDKTDIVIVTKFKFLKNKGQGMKIKTLKGNYELPVPPELAQDMTDKGKIFCECFISEGGEATWILMTAKVSTVKVKHNLMAPQFTKDGKPRLDADGEQLFLEKEIEKIEEVELTRLTTDDKEFYFNRERILQEKYKTHNLWSFLSQHGGTIAFLMFVALLFIFWGDVMGPAIEMAETNQAFFNTMTTKMDGVLDRVDSIVYNRQKLEAELPFNVSQPGPG